MMKNWFRALIIQLILQCIYESVYSISTTYTTYLEEHFETTTGSYSTINDQFVPSKPTNLSVLEVTSTTIKIKWHEPENANDALAGYVVYYLHKNQTLNQKSRISEIKTGPTVQFLLPNLKPYSEYKIYVKAFTQYYEGDASDSIVQITDISGPSPPIVVNLTCHSQDTLFLRWRRPLEFYRSIDFYTIAYKRDEQNAFREIILNASAIHLELALQIPNLTTNFIYEVKVCASSISAIHPNHIINGSFSEPKKILMQQDCQAIQPLLRQSQDDYSPTMLVVIILSCLGVLLCILAIVLWRKCFQAAYYYLDDAPGQAQTSLLIDWEAPVDLGGEVRAAVPVSEFAKHVAQLHADGDIGYSKEYEALQNESIVEEHPSEQSQHPDNKTKNRYLNIIAYDHSRVLLRSIPGQKKTFDYINANFIDGYKKSRAFIATQGPLPGTFDSFWSMIWEQRVAIIVMITNLVERGRRKCDMYWPKVGTETYGVIQVRFIQEEVMATYTVRTFQIKHLKIKKKKHVAEKLVYQYHYTNWPDHGTPDHPLPVLNFVKKSADANPRDAGPIIVHCSAGVGRTGTYIVLDAMLKQIEHKNVVNVFGFLRHIRAQRNFLVQTEEQYIFIHDALLEAIVSGETNVKADVIMDIKDDKEVLAQQFKLITQFKAKDVQMASAIKPVNLVKNRSLLVPLEGSRVHLTPKPGEEGSDYINASWFQGFRRLRDFIVTQHPMESTIKDFWQMIWDHSAQTIVLLSPIDDPNLPQFWPDDAKKIDSDHYRINFVSKINKCDYISRDFTMQSIQDDYELSVKMFHCSRWPELGHPASIFDFIVDVHQRGSEYKNGPIVIVDPLGGTQACTFCVIASQAMQMEYDSTTNVYTYCKLYHNKRPGVWNSVDDLKQIYNLLSYLPSDLSLLKFTEIRTELEDVTTAAPDLYSKVTSNGNISSSLINTTNGTAIINGNGENDEFSVVCTESDNIEV